MARRHPTMSRMQGVRSGGEERNKQKQKQSKPQVQIGADDVGSLLSRFLEPSESVARDITLYQRAMVHWSCAGKRQKRQQTGGSYERLEFLGDAVLSLVAASYLFERYPDANEGFMTRMRTKLVNGRMLADLCSRHTTLPDFVATAHASATPTAKAEGEREGEGEEHAEDVSGAGRHVLEDVFEAFLGALFVDLGFDVARRWLVGFLEENVDFAELVASQDNAKDVLNRHCMRNLGFLPRMQEVGQKDGETFVRVVTPAGAVVATGSGACRRAAEDVAAKRALSYYDVL